ncbi:MAG: tRNA-guanine transglycosylase [Candidatus Methanofastidiosa archaeon]|nr:tRNA-guanine transglycosylase [Candidatus Methanofastidiosa archaeon]
MTEPQYKPGLIRTPHGRIRTPALIPVVAASYGIWDLWIDGDCIAPWDLSQATILSLYHILPYKRRERIFSEGIHKALGTKRPVWLDSGGFQYMRKGAELDPMDVLGYQKMARSDVAVTFDYPITPGLDEQNKLLRLERSISSANMMLEKKGDMMLYGAIHGSTPREIVDYIGCLDDGFDGFGIGSLVPRKSQYAYLSGIISAVRNRTDKPLHAFGITGFPAMYALSYLGIDTFDSWTYLVAASFKEYIHPEKLNRIKRLKELSSLPECGCPVCQEHGLKDFVGPDSASEMLLALHNLYVFMREMENVREAVSRNELEEYIMGKCECGNRNISIAFREAKRVIEEKK